jgi:YfiH family protein
MMMKLYSFSLDGATAAPFVRFPFLLDGEPLSGFSCCLTLGAAGNMYLSSGRNNPNRDALYSSLGVDASRVHACVQSHSRRVACAEAGKPDRFYDADGLVAEDPAVCLSVTVADCLPIFLLDVEHGVFSVLHSGWKGTGIAGTALGMMSERWGTRAQAVSAVLGPCIRGCCYEVDRGRAVAFQGEFGDRTGPYPLGPPVRMKVGQDKGFIDLQAANANILASAGVENISYCENCTRTDLSLGSYRREGAQAYTSMAALVGQF